MSGCSLARFADPLPKAADLSSLNGLLGIWVARDPDQRSISFQLLHFQPGRGNVIRVSHETEMSHDVYRGLVHRDGDTCLVSLQKRIKAGAGEEPEVFAKDWWYFRMTISGQRAVIEYMQDPNEAKNNLEVFGTGFFGAMTYTPDPRQPVWAMYKSPEEILTYLKSPDSKPLWTKWMAVHRAFLWSDLPEPDPFEGTDEPQPIKPTFK